MTFPKQLRFALFATLLVTCFFVQATSYAAERIVQLNIPGCAS